MESNVQVSSGSTTTRQWSTRCFDRLKAGASKARLSLAQASRSAVEQRERTVEHRCIFTQVTCEPARIETSEPVGNHAIGRRSRHCKTACTANHQLQQAFPLVEHPVLHRPCLLSLHWKGRAFKQLGQAIMHRPRILQRLVL